MTITASSTTAPTDAVAEYRVAFAEAANNLAGGEPLTDPFLRRLLEQVAREEISADEANAAARQHIQG